MFSGDYRIYFSCWELNVQQLSKHWYDVNLYPTYVRRFV